MSRLQALWYKKYIGKLQWVWKGPKKIGSRTFCLWEFGGTDHKQKQLRGHPFHTCKEFLSRWIVFNEVSGRRRKENGFKLEWGWLQYDVKKYLSRQEWSSIRTGCPRKQWNLSPRKTLNWWKLTGTLSEFRAILPQAEDWNRNLLRFKHEYFYYVILEKTDC